MQRTKEKISKIAGFLGKHKKIVMALVILLIVVRLWLFVTMNWFINFQTYYDGRLEMNTAVDMASGNWAGVYSKLTLCKSLAFPIFLAISLVTRIPYSVCLFMLALLAASLFVKSLEPLINKKRWKIILFLFILYNPTGLGGGAVYPYRIALASWVVLIVISCIIAIILRRDNKIRKLLPWGLTGLVFSGFFWNLREDSIWFLPFVLFACILTVALRYFDLKKKKVRGQKGVKYKVAFVAIALCPLCGILIWNTVISSINYSAYGIYTTEDRTKTYEAKVLGALIRIDDGADLENDYWVSSEALELAKEASPTFASLNTEPFDKWSKIGDYSIWALRDSVEASGYYTDAKSTNELYEKIYDELEQAFKDGVLKRKDAIQLSDTSGMYTFNEMLKPIGTAFDSLVNHVLYNEYVVELERPTNSLGENDYVYYESVLMTTLWRDDEQLSKINADSSMIKNNKILYNTLRVNRKISNCIIYVYNAISCVLFVGAFCGVFAMAYTIIKKKSFTNFRVEMLIILIGLLLTALLYGYLVGLWGLGYNLDARDNLFQGYTTPISIIIMCFEVVGTCYLFMYCKEQKGKRNKGSKCLKSNGSKVC